jgi:hypothetical protein
MDIVSYVLLSAVVAVQNRNVLSRSPYEVFGRHSLPDVRRDVKIVLRREAEQDDANTESPTNTSIIRVSQFDFRLATKCGFTLLFARITTGITIRNTTSLSWENTHG